MATENRDPILLDLLESYEKPNIQGRIPIEWSLGRQIERCNITNSAIDPSLFEKNVKTLIPLLPDSVRDEVSRFMENECVTKVDKLEFKRFCGVPMGTLNKPHKNADGDVISPITVTEEYVDYEKLYARIMTAIEDLGLTWKTGSGLIDTGRVRDRLKVPEHIMSEAKAAVNRILLEAEKEGVYIHPYDMINAMVPDKPPAEPTLTTDEDYLKTLDQELEEEPQPEEDP